MADSDPRDEDGEEKDPRKAYDHEREAAHATAAADLTSGAWFPKVIRWVLETYARRVDADYIRKRYPGAGPANHAKKAIQLTSWHASLVGGASAASVTAIELFGVPAGGLLAIPAIAAAVLADLTLTTRAQLRATYDLSVIHGAPLDLNDVEDCQLVFATAMGIKFAEEVGDFAKAVGPQIIAFNVRRMLRSGFRQTLVAVIKKIAGVQLAKKLTEKALMRLLVPGISVPLSAGMSYAFTRSILRTANKRMARRGAIVRPLKQIFALAPDLPRQIAIKALITVLESPGRLDGWEEGQLDALRYAQAALQLTDDEVAALDAWFDRKPADLAAELPTLPANAGSALVEYLATSAALGSQPAHDADYAKAVSTIAAAVHTEFDPEELPRFRKRFR